MKTSSIGHILTNRLIPILMGTSLAMSAFAAPQRVWIARPTGGRQCETISRSTLGPSIEDLEFNQLVVRQAAVGTLADQLQCQACGVCPNGKYNFALIEDAPHAQETSRSTGWEIVNVDAVRIEE